MAKFTEADLRTGLGEALVQVTELRAELLELQGNTGQKAYQELTKCRESNAALATQGKERWQTIEDQGKEIAELKVKLTELTAELVEANETYVEQVARIEFLQQTIKGQG